MWSAFTTETVFLNNDKIIQRLLNGQNISLLFKDFIQGGIKNKVDKRNQREENKGLANALLTQRRCSYLMLIIKTGFKHGRCFCYFPTPLEPSPCDSPPLHPGKLFAWTAANKNSPVRGMWGPAPAPLLRWEDTSLCISSSLPKAIICKCGPLHKEKGMPT